MNYEWIKYWLISMLFKFLNYSKLVVLKFGLILKKGVLSLSLGEDN